MWETRVKCDEENGGRWGWVDRMKRFDEDDEDDEEGEDEDDEDDDRDGRSSGYTALQI